MIENEKDMLEIISFQRSLIDTLKEVSEDQKNTINILRKKLVDSSEAVKMYSDSVTNLMKERDDFRDALRSKK